jgi:SAM-dependent methyltransferase
MGAAKQLHYNFLDKCGGCGSSQLSLSFDFGKVPLAGYFPQIGEEIIELLPMELLYCENCKLHQISPNLDDSFLFADYRYVSSIGMQAHFNELASWFVANFNPSSQCKILEIGCNDGPLLDALTNLGFSPIGIDPATNIAQVAVEKGFSVINDFFGPRALKKYQEIQNMDYIFSSNSFAHISDIQSIAESVAKSLAPSGKFIVEVQSLFQLVEKGAMDFIYHEHKYYYTIVSISNLLNRFGLYLEKCVEVEVHGGSYRFVFSKKEVKSDLPTQILAEAEIKHQLNASKLQYSVNKFNSEMYKLDNFLFQAQEKELSIAAFGASGRGNMILGNLPKSKAGIKFVIDESPERVGRLMAQNNLLIRDFSDIDCAQIDILLILAWNFSGKIISKWRSEKTTFVLPLPTFTIESQETSKG